MFFARKISLSTQQDNNTQNLSVHTLYPTCYSRIPQCNAVVVFPRRRRSWITAKTNTFNDGDFGFRLEMLTIYLGFNIEYLTFKINLKKTWTRKCNIQHQYNLQLSSWVPGLFTWCGRICLRHTNTRLNMSVWKLVRYASVPNRAPRTETVQYKYMYRYTPNTYTNTYNTFIDACILGL
jgi:hypothetical protein